MNDPNRENESFEDYLARVAEESSTNENWAEENGFGDGD